MTEKKRMTFSEMCDHFHTYIQKKGRNDFKGYNYVKVSDILSVVNKIYAKENYILTEFQEIKETQSGRLFVNLVYSTYLLKNGAPDIKIHETNYPYELYQTIQDKNKPSQDRSAWSTEGRRYGLFSHFNIFPEGDHDVNDLEKPAQNYTRKAPAQASYKQRASKPLNQTGYKRKTPPPANKKPTAEEDLLSTANAAKAVGDIPDAKETWFKCVGAFKELGLGLNGLAILERSGIDKNIKPQDLTPLHFKKLAELYMKEKKNARAVSNLKKK